MARKIWCDDWSCPARVSCAHNFGRSAAYASMRERVMVAHGPFTSYDRHASEEGQSCDAYRRDRAKLWLMPQPGQVNVDFGSP